MIKLEVEPYCHECPDFDPDLQRPEQEVLYSREPGSGRPTSYVRISDTIVRCKYRIRCQKIQEYLGNQKNSKYPEKIKDPRDFYIDER